MSEPAVTIVVSQRESFHRTQASLQSIYASTAVQFKLVYVDGNSPPEVARYLKEEAVCKGFQLIRLDRYLCPNEARNLGLAQVETRFVAFVDNDLILLDGWLDSLLQCAQETGAWAVSPLYLDGDINDPQVHNAGGIARFENVHGVRRFTEKHAFQHKKLSSVESQICRQETELFEFHCVLMNTEFFKLCGPLDEKIRSFSEHVDAGLAIRECGQKIYIEPLARVFYAYTGKFKHADLMFALKRWSDCEALQTMQHLRNKWNLADGDPYLLGTVQWVRFHRRRIMIHSLPVVRAFCAAKTFRKAAHSRNTTVGRQPLVTTGAPSHHYAQTSIQLMNQLRAMNYSSVDCCRIEDCINIAHDLFSHERESGKSFVAHVIGVCSILASQRQSIDLLCAALVHAAYFTGSKLLAQSEDFSARRERLRALSSREIEDYVYRYATISWNDCEMHALADWQSRELRDQQACLMRIANELEEALDLGISFTSPERLSLYLRLLRSNWSDIQSLTSHMGCNSMFEELSQYQKLLEQDALAEVSRFCKSTNTKEPRDSVRASRGSDMVFSSPGL